MPKRIGMLKVKAESKKGVKPVIKKTVKSPKDYNNLIKERELEIADGIKLIFRVSKTSEGDPHVDIRTYVETEKYTGFTKKGINFNIEFLEDFKDILNILDNELAEKGL